MRGSVLYIAFFCGVSGCSRTESLELVLRAARSPDPFSDVQRLRLTGLAAGSRVDLGEYRWDQGAFDARLVVPPSLRRVVLEGIDRDGQLLASAVSARLDLILDPPDGPVELLFTRVGVFSELDRTEPGFRTLSGVSDQARWFFGGTTPDGCPWLSSERIDRTGRLSGGPRLPALGTARLLGISPSGRFMGAVPGLDASCRGEDGLLLVVFDGNEFRTAPWSGSLPDGAALAVLDGGDGLMFGGSQGTQVQTDVVELDGVTLERRSVAQLDRPLTDARAVQVPGSRVALVGGRSRTSTLAAVSEASLFSIETLSTQGQRVGLVQGRLLPAVARLRSGSVVVAAGTDRGRPISMVEVLSVSFDPTLTGMSEAYFSDALGTPRGQLVDLDDGSLLWIPEEGDRAQWLQLLPKRTVSVPLPPESLLGGYLRDGLAVFRGESGRVYGFNAGPSGVVQKASPDIGRPDAGPVGFVPSRPGAWSFEENRLVGSVQEELPDDPLPRAVMVVSTETRSDFELAFDADLQGVVAIMFGFDGNDFDQVVLLNRPRYVRSPALRVRGAVECRGDPVVVPGSRRVRLRRTAEGRRVELDVNDDLQPDLVCVVDAPPEGDVAIGLVSGTVRFDSLSLAGP